MTDHVIDPFTDTNGTGLNSHAPDTDVVGTGYFNVGYNSSYSGGGGTIQSNQAQLGTDNFGHAIDTGQADGTFEIDWITDSGGSNRNSIILRHSSAGNQWLWVVREPNGDWFLYEMQSDSNTQRDTGTYSWSAGSTYTLRVELSGNSIDLYVNDSLVGGYASATFNNTATKHGFIRNTGSTSTRFDDFSFTTASGSTILPLLNAYHG